MKLSAYIDNPSLCVFFLILSEEPLITVVACLNFPNAKHIPYFVSYYTVRVKMIAAKMNTLQSFRFFDSLENWKDVLRLNKVASG